MHDEFMKFAARLAVGASDASNAKVAVSPTWRSFDAFSEREHVAITVTTLDNDEEEETLVICTVAEWRVFLRAALS